MAWIRFSLTLAAIVAATVSAALWQGRLRNRWGPSEAALKAAARLQEFPGDFGDWHMTSAGDLDEYSLNELECVGQTVRVYQNKKTGEQVTLLFILGPTGPTAVHTPEICVGQREFSAVGERREVEIGGDQFWNKRFKSKGVHGELMSVYWAWNTGKGWLAARDARYKFAGLPFLYKAQVSCGCLDDRPDDAGQRFLAAFVPVAAKYVSADIQD